MKTIIKIEAYESDDKFVLCGKREKLTMESHWNENEWCILEIGKKRITVSRIDLISATIKASNR